MLIAALIIKRSPIKMRPSLYMCILLCFLTVVSGANAAVNIQSFTTPKGLNVWLVESHEIPMVSVEIGFRAGGSFDPPQREGLAYFTSALLNEGAGHLDATSFQEEVDKIGASIGGSADKLNLTIGLTTLSEQIDPAFYLLGLAVREPRFDEKAAERIKGQILASLKRDEENPGSVISKNYRRAIYGLHPYGKPLKGFADTVELFSSKNAAFFHKNYMTRENMVISVVGDVTKAKLSKLLDENIADLSRGKKRQKVALAPDAPFAAIVKVPMAVPQAHIMMGHQGISRHDPDYFAAYAMNYILGGGGFNSRLMEEVREKRGLAYSVYSYFAPLPHAGSFTASVQTKNKDAFKTISLMRKEFHRMRDALVSEKEYEGAINYLTGSFPLRIDSNSKILGYLTTMQMENLGIDYLSTWQNKVKSVTREDMQRVARRLLQPENLVTVIVGDEEAIEAYSKKPW